LGRDTVVKSAGLKYFAQKPEAAIQFVAIRKWNSRSPNPYLPPINPTLLLSPAFGGEDKGEGGMKVKKRGYLLRRELSIWRRKLYQLRVLEKKTKLTSISTSLTICAKSSSMRFSLLLNPIHLIQ
jgi:hypothetical protein